MLYFLTVIVTIFFTVPLTAYVIWRFDLTHEEVTEVIKEEIAKHTVPEAEIAMEPAPVPVNHVHTNQCWRRGILPGQVYVKTCTATGEIVKGITQEEWLRTL